MLFLSDASTVIFLKFLQILLWISIPAFIIGMLVTILIHYRSKKRKREGSSPLRIEAGNNNFSGYDDFTLVPREYDLPGNQYEIKGVIHQLFHSKARYIAIRKDFEVLNEKYQKLNINNHTISQTIKQKTMETTHPDMQQNFSDQLESIKQQYELEKKQLHHELSQLNSAYENLERDNANLQDQVNAYSNDDSKVTEVIHKWDLEKAELKKKIAEQEYLKDVLEEKKIQITFLQQQLEQRIRNHHLVEQQFRDLGIKFMEVKEELEIKQQSEMEFQTAVHEKDRQITGLNEQLQSKSGHADALESSIAGLREQNESCLRAIEENNKLIEDLRGQLEDNNRQKKELERKLERSQTYFKGLHRKLADILEEDIAELPVIVMKPGFISENEKQLSESVIQ